MRARRGRTGAAMPYDRPVDHPFRTREDRTPPVDEPEERDSPLPHRTSGKGAPRSPVVARIAAAITLVIMGATLVVVVGYTLRHLGYLVVAFVAAGLGVSAVWIVFTNRRWRWPALVAAVLLPVGAIACLVAAGDGAVVAVVVAIGTFVTGSLGSFALRHQVGTPAPRWRSVPASTHPVLLMNPRSGGGKVNRYDLLSECAHRGIEPLVLQPGDDLRQLAESAVARGADVLGMAGGDGSQALVASVAAAHDIGYVCVPAGTRNHLALDLGVDRDDLVGALDAFGPAREFRVDLATVNGRVFVNNVSLGLYATMVASPSYRDDKARTAAQTIEERLGVGAPPFDLHLDGPRGVIDGPQVVEISNNPYDLSSLGGFATRSRMDAGRLGVVTIRIDGPAELRRLVALEAAGRPERFSGFNSWTARTLAVRSSSPVAAGIDGETCQLDAPVHCACLPGALRVRIVRGYPGAAWATRPPPLTASTAIGLWAVVRGRPVSRSGRR